jgi:maltose alpha-D-glucosyltransferase/alpha-amylase
MLPAGLPRAQALYGSLPEQLKSPDSFASRLKAMPAARKKYGVHEGNLLAVPEPKAAGVCTLALRLPDGNLAVTVHNFDREEVSEEIDLGDAGKDAAGEWTDILAGKAVEGWRLKVRLPALTGHGVCGRLEFVPRNPGTEP